MKITSFKIVVLAVLMLMLIIAGCSKKESTVAEPSAPAGYSEELVLEGTDEYCLSCHGSYDEQAATTAHLGDWNPHDSIHGGYVSCKNCHYEDKVLSLNYCAVCHDYKPDKTKTGVEF